eukprot:GHUV01016994.1.p1 GENE.GHUV01016994.1~~GHUV01016994.1.p1  ORF type:complete len:252 (+),score=70.24 GHUV01016994.1:559-1314(+)
MAAEAAAHTAKCHHVLDMAASSRVCRPHPTHTKLHYCKALISSSAMTAASLQHSKQASTSSSSRLVPELHQNIAACRSTGSSRRSSVLVHPAPAALQQQVYIVGIHSGQYVSTGTPAACSSIAQAAALVRSPTQMSRWQVDPYWPGPVPLRQQAFILSVRIGQRVSTATSGYHKTTAQAAVTGRPATRIKSTAAGSILAWSCGFTAANLDHQHGAFRHTRVNCRGSCAALAQSYIPANTRSTRSSVLAVGA